MPSPATTAHGSKLGRIHTIEYSHTNALAGLTAFQVIVMPCSVPTNGKEKNGRTGFKQPPRCCSFAAAANRSCVTALRVEPANLSVSGVKWVGVVGCEHCNKDMGSSLPTQQLSPHTVTTHTHTHTHIHTHLSHSAPLPNRFGSWPLHCH